jgi:hypothetical protein
MSLITVDYFTSPITVANRNNPAVMETLQACIDKHETIFLQKALGYNFAKLMLAGYGVGSPEVRWLTLVEGGEYEDSNFVPIGYWPGFVKNTAPFVSSIANYVFTQWTSELIVQRTGSGDVRTKNENAENADGSLQNWRIWQAMQSDLEKLWAFLRAKGEDVYPEYVSSKVSGSFFSGNNSFGI